MTVLRPRKRTLRRLNRSVCSFRDGELPTALTRSADNPCNSGCGRATSWPRSVCRPALTLRLLVHQPRYAESCSLPRKWSTGGRRCPESRQEAGDGEPHLVAIFAPSRSNSSRDIEGTE